MLGGWRFMVIPASAIAFAGKLQFRSINLLSDSCHSTMCLSNATEHHGISWGSACGDLDGDGNLDLLTVGNLSGVTSSSNVVEEYGKRICQARRVEKNNGMARFSSRFHRCARHVVQSQNPRWHSDCFRFEQGRFVFWMWV